MLGNSEEPQVGQAAPNFTLEDENGTPVTLADLRGEVVMLIFYPWDWSYLCTKELCEMRDTLPEFNGTSASVFGISRDSKYSHKAWKEHLGLTYSLLADLRGDVAKLYGCWNEASYRANRMTVVIDPEGIVRYMVHNPSSTVRDQREALEVARSMSVGSA